MSIAGNMIGSYSQIGKTFIITDEEGNELNAVVTDKEVILTANAATDIRDGTVAVTDEGIVTGSKIIPSYHTYEGTQLITAGSQFKIRNIYDGYTKLQALVCAFNTSLLDSVLTEKVVINDNVYNVQSVVSVSLVDKQDDAGYINLGITNDSSDMKILRYFYYKEIY